MKPELEVGRYGTVHHPGTSLVGSKPLRFEEHRTVQVCRSINVRNVGMII